MTTGHKDVPWDSDPDPSWAPSVQEWAWEDLNGQWVKQGLCPRCEGTMFVALGLSSLRAEAGQQVYAECNCSYKHSSHSEEGCGQQAMIGGPT